MKPFQFGSPPRLQYSPATIAGLFDGNSLVAGVGTFGPSGYINNQTAQLAPFSSAISLGNTGVSGQTINNMRGITEVGGSGVPSTGDVDTAFSFGKTNLLFAWEGTNSIFNHGWTGLQAGDQMRLYCQERLAVHPWKIILVTTIPRFSVPQNSGFSTAQANAELLAYDTYLRANYRSMGAAEVAWIRAPGSPFAISSFNQSDFETPTLNALFSFIDAANEHVHLQNAGYAVVAQFCADAAKRVRR